MARTKKREGPGPHMTRTRKRAIERIRLPSKSERRDMKTPCAHCGATPTIITMRGRIQVERSCPTCGRLEYLNDAAIMV